MTPVEQKMLKVCLHCGKRYGQHFGDNRCGPLDVEDYTGTFFQWSGCYHGEHKFGDPNYQFLCRKANQ